MDLREVGVLRAPEHERRRPGRRRGAWPRAGPSRRCPSARRACRRPASSARSAASARGQRDRHRRRLDLDLELRAPRRVLAQVAARRSSIERTRVRARRDAHGDLGPRVRDHDVARRRRPPGASRPRTEIAWRAHRRSASVAGADQRDAVEHAGLAAEVGLGPVRAVPVAVLEALDRDVARRRRAASRSAGSARAARRARRRRTGRCAARRSSVRSVTVSLPWPRRVCDSVGSPTFQLPPSAITITSARISSGSASTSASSALAAVLLGALDQHLDVHRRLAVPGAQRGEVGDDAGLVVGGAAPVDAAVLERRRERVGLPAFRRRGLDVVVRVEQHGRARRPGSRRGSSATRRARRRAGLGARPPRAAAPRRARPPRPAARAGSPRTRSRGWRRAARDPSGSARRRQWLGERPSRARSSRERPVALHAVAVATAAAYVTIEG